MTTLRSLRRLAAPLLPRFLKQAVVDALSHDLPSDDVAFRPCSPASPPELAQSIYELHAAGRLEGGSYYEFGLYRGYALWFAQDLIRRLGVKEFHFHGFDSFRGLPEPKGVDEDAPWKGGDYAVSRERVEAYLREFDADLGKISLHEGFFSDELFAALEKRHEFGRAALVLVDCDLYASTVPVLRFLRDRLVDGSIVLFDDYNCFDGANDKGQRRALKEFLVEHPQIHAEALRPFGWHGQGFRIRVEG
jgi:hypothetical protein